MPDTTLTTLAVATGGAFLGKFVGPAAEAIGKAAWEQAQQLGARATAYLAAVGREPQPVEPKLLLPLVQAASLETDEVLAEKWAALLANAADPAQHVAVQPGFAEVLRQLTSQEAIVIDHLYFPKHPVHEGRISRVNTITYYDINQMLGHQGEFNSELIVDDLKRLRLCDSFDVYREEKKSYDSYLRSTEFGFRFMLACAPPTP